MANFRPSAPIRPLCGLCRRPVSRQYRQSAAGTVSCAHHPWCSECGIAHLRLPCAEVRGRILNAKQAAPAIKTVLRDVRDLGIRLPRVPIKLVGRLPENVFGECRQGSLCRDDRTLRMAAIKLLRGQGPTRFGHTVVHEHAHALIHLSGRALVDPSLQEGVCEMLAVSWLTHRRTSREYLANLWQNPDPIYGEQMRLAIAAAKRSSAQTVIKSVLATGRLP